MSNISRINLCEVDIELNGKTRTLVPTLWGILLVCKFGGFEKLIQGILNENVEAILVGLQAGLNLSEKKTRRVDNLLWKTGITPELVEKLIEFLENLNRGGKLALEENQTTEISFSSEVFTMETWADKLFLTASGWLGWTPETVLRSNINMIHLAIEGKVDFVKKTNPFGSGDDEPGTDVSKRAPEPGIAAQQLQNFMRRKIREQSRKNKN
jgi:hypothetical protein